MPFREHLPSQGIERLTPETAHPSVAFMFRQVGRRAELYRRLLGNGGSAYFVTRFLARNEELFLQVWRLLDQPQDGRQPPAEMRARFAASACLGLFSIWLERGRLESADVMAAWFWRLARPAWFETAFPDGDRDGAPPQR